MDGTKDNTNAMQRLGTIDILGKSCFHAQKSNLTSA